MENRNSDDNVNTDPLELFNKASQAMENEAYEEALELAQRALQDELTGDEIRQRLYIMIAYCHYQADRYEDALAYFRKGAKDAKMSDDELYAFAHTLYLSDQNDEAAEVLDHIIDRYDDNHDVVHMRGLAEYYRDEPDFDKALNWLQRAAKLDSERTEYFLIADSLRMLERFEESLPYYEKALELNPDADYIYYYYGLSLYFSDRVDETLAAFRKAVELNDDYAQAHMDLGRIYLESGRKNEALVHIEKAVAMGHPDAKDTLKELMESEFDTSQSSQTEEDSQDDEYEYYDDEASYFNFPEDEPDRSIHPLIQPTWYSRLLRFPMKMIFISIGLIIGLLFVVGVFIFEHEKVNEIPPALSESLRAYDNTAFVETSIISEGDKRYERRIARGTTLLPVAWYGRSLLVELPNGERGIVPQNTIDKYYRVYIPPGIHLYDTPQTRSSAGTIGENGTRGVVLSSVGELVSRRYEVQLADGSVSYVSQFSVQSDLSRMEIPRINRSNRRLYQLDHLNDKLAGADLRQLTRRLGIPTSRIIEQNSGRVIYMFPSVMIVNQGERYPRTAVTTKEDRVTAVLPQGEPQTVRADQFTYTAFIQNLGLPNLYLQRAPWTIAWQDREPDLISRGLDRVKEWSSLVGWIVHILVIILFIGLVLWVLYGFFSLPLLLLWPFVRLIGTKTKLPNGLINLAIWLLMGILFIAFYYVSVVTFNLTWSGFALTLYGIALFFFYLYLAFQTTSYINCVRCKDCRIWGCTRDLGSIYLGYKRKVSYERVYKGSSTSLDGKVRTHYYETRPKVSFTYYYQDFYGCRLCGLRWWNKESAFKQRNDMDHSRIPK